MAGSTPSGTTFLTWCDPAFLVCPEGAPFPDPQEDQLMPNAPHNDGHTIAIRATAGDLYRATDC
uniref:hypothetical protein n=1 Tax=Streptomyces sp. Tue6028 TaxID=2036037 RepID=UPI003EC11900